MILDGKKRENIQKAVELILKGQVVAFPTETVYGLGADGFNSEALKKIFEIKQRPFEDPLIFHIAKQEQLSTLTNNVSEDALRLIESFWPGPLTIIFQKLSSVPSLATAGRDTVAVRMPRHLTALALIQNANRVIAAPSANRFQKLSPTTAKAVEKDLGDRVPLILDGGSCLVGVESTVLSLIEEPQVLRPGGISVEDIESVLEKKIQVVDSSQVKEPVSPGLLLFHYAPEKPLIYLNESGLTRFVGKKRNKNLLEKSILICFSREEEKKFLKKGFGDILVLSKRGNFGEAAQNLFSYLRLADEGKWDRIFALECPSERLGLAINDRLKKAEHGFENN